jgi:ABC-type phosphate/phosphonate transport system substrate-binding protein
MFAGVPEASVRAAARTLAEVFRARSGLGGEVEFVPDAERLAARMTDGGIDIGVFHGFEYAWVHDRYPEVEPLAVAVPPGKLQACLVVHKDSGVASPKDLRGPCVAVPMFTTAHCRLFLDRLRAGLSSDCCGPAGCDSLSPEEVLDRVSRAQLACALVDDSAMRAYELNKPGACKLLRVIRRSEAFPAGVIAVRKGALPPGAAAAIRKGLEKAKDTPQGRAFLMLWQLRGFEGVPTGFDAELWRIAKAYPPPAAPPGNLVARPE